MRKNASSETRDLVYEVLLMAKEVCMILGGKDVFFVCDRDTYAEREKTKREYMNRDKIRTGCARRF